MSGMERVKGKADRVHWCDRGWQPVYYGFCPSEKAWHRDLKRLDVQDEPYPDTHGRCTVFENQKTGQISILVTISEEAKNRKPVEVVGLLVHEATHVWQQVRSAMRERKPSIEFEAYSMQAISQELIEAYEQTRGPIYGGR